MSSDVIAKITVFLDKLIEDQESCISFRFAINELLQE